MSRRIWVAIPSPQPGGRTYYTDCRVVGFKRFLPAGPIASGDPSSYDGIRLKHLVQVYTDPGGLRTLSVGQIRMRRPKQARPRPPEPGDQQQDYE